MPCDTLPAIRRVAWVYGERIHLIKGSSAHYYPLLSCIYALIRLRNVCCGFLCPELFTKTVHSCFLTECAYIHSFTVSSLGAVLSFLWLFYIKVARCSLQIAHTLNILLFRFASLTRCNRGIQTRRLGSCADRTSWSWRGRDLCRAGCVVFSQIIYWILINMGGRAGHMQAAHSRPAHKVSTDEQMGAHCACAIGSFRCSDVLISAVLWEGSFQQFSAYLSTQDFHWESMPSRPQSLDPTADCSLGRMIGPHSCCPPAPMRTMNAATLRDDQTQA
jgi:hypothetical protein